MNLKLSWTRQALVKVWALLIVLALGALWTPTPSLAEGPETFSYTVQAGDTLYKLAVRFGTTVDELVALNDIRDPDLIYVGQVLLIPAGGAPADRGPSPPPSGGPLSFTWDRIGWRYEGPDYYTRVQITASGGQPPYTYYHDGLVQEGNTFEVAWKRGRPKPGSVGLADAMGYYIKEDYWLKDPCGYPAGVRITEPDEGEKLSTFPHFNIEWEHTVASPPDGYRIEIQNWRDGKYRDWQLYYYPRGDSELFFVPDEFPDESPGNLSGRVRMWGVYGNCEADSKTSWRHFEFR